VAGFARQHAEIDPNLFQRSLIFGAGIGPEDQFGVGRAVQPAIALDLGLELPGGPAGITEGENGARRPFAACNRFENIDRGGQTNAVVDRERRIFDEEIG
jgi:hypothetical protein